MPFTKKHRKAHTSELQHRLYVISLNDERIPAVIPDGNYNKNTKGAVTTFQSIHGLEPTGEVDLETWNMITDEFKKYSLEPIKLDIFPKGFILLPGSRGELVYIIQILLNILSCDYENCPKIDINGVYTPQMDKAVKNFKRISNTDKNIDGIGLDTWNMLIKKINSKDFSSPKLI